ncbi:hypothetical protein, partial [Helicobacter ganmani]|uniref:hypothetical protein n=2 Tax=Helicobacter ganmani TaxID=60246 RepID=UPI003A861E90
KLFFADDTALCKSGKVGRCGDESVKNEFRIICFCYVSIKSNDCLQHYENLYPYFKTFLSNLASFVYPYSNSYLQIVFICLYIVLVVGFIAWITYWNPNFYI